MDQQRQQQEEEHDPRCCEAVVKISLGFRQNVPRRCHRGKKCHFCSMLLKGNCEMKNVAFDILCGCGALLIEMDSTGKDESLRKRLRWHADTFAENPRSSIAEELRHCKSRASFRSLRIMPIGYCVHHIPLAKMVEDVEVNLHCKFHTDRLKSELCSIEM